MTGYDNLSNAILKFIKNILSTYRQKRNENISKVEIKNQVVNSSKNRRWFVGLYWDYIFG